MHSRSVFTVTDFFVIHSLFGKLEKASAEDAKRLRDGLRGLGFFIRHLQKAGLRFLLKDLQQALDSGNIKIRMT